MADDVAQPLDEMEGTAVPLADDTAPPQGMAKCEITGNLVPEDELIEIEGKRVCAEGKEELLRRLRSGELMPGEMERPTVLRRFCCLLIDNFITGVAGGSIGFAIGLIMASSAGSTGGMVRLQAMGQLAGVSITVLYFGLLHGLKGQSVGKMAGKLKVVNLDGSSISLSRGFLRAAFLAGPQIVTPFILLATGSASVLGIASAIVGIYALTNIIFALIDRDAQRPLHDRFSGTRVIRL